MTDELYIPPPVGKPFGVYGVDVTLLTPVFMTIVLPVSWPPNHFPSFEESGDCSDRLERVIRYMVNEGLIMGSGTGCNVFMRHNAKS